MKFNGVLKEISDKYGEINIKSYLQSRLKLPDYKAELLAERLTNSFDFAEAKEKNDREKEISVKPLLKIKEKNIKVNIYSLDLLSGREFESFLKWLFEEMGYEVKLTKIVADSGVDLVVSNEQEKIAVQAKRYSRDTKISNETILKTHGGRDIYDCKRSIVITTSYFTPKAIQDAKKLKIEMWDRDYLAATIEQINEKTKLINEKPSFPVYRDSLIKSIHGLEKMGIFYIDAKENGKSNLYRHGIHHPLLTFYERSLNNVSKCVFRIKDKKPVGEKEGEGLIFTISGYTYGPDGRDGYKKVIDYLSEFV